MELTRPKIESRDPIFFTGTRSRSRVSGNDRLFPRGSEFGPNLEIPAGPAIQLRPRPAEGLPSTTVNRSRPNWIAGPGPKSEPVGKSESRGPENWVSRWRRPNSDIYSQNRHFGLVYDMIWVILQYWVIKCDGYTKK